jgi:excinuclease ABC subunit A
MGAIEVKMQYLHSTWIRCADCAGQRFNEEVLAAWVTFGAQDLSIADFYQLAIEEAAILFEEETRLPPARLRAAKRILRALRDVGLGYLPLGQPSPTLSGGEAQRVKLSTELSRRATGRTLYILDEPTTGLSFEDVAALLRVLQRLVEAGNTVVVIEHHLDVIKNADHIIDLGPGAGDLGGYVVAAGTPEEIVKTKSSATGQYLGRVLCRNVEPALAGS